MKNLTIVLLSLIMFLFCAKERSPMEKLKMSIKLNQEGLMFLRMLQWDKALTAFAEAEELDPTNAEYPNNKGFCFMNMGQLDNALVEFTKAIEVDPKFGRAYYNIGVIYQKKENYSQAIKFYNKATEIMPEIPETYFNLGIVHSRIKNDQLAIANYSKYITLASPNDKRPIEDAKRKINELKKSD